MDKVKLKEMRANSPVGRIFDFPDRLSPMLIKELRQGVRSISFVAGFLAFQGLMLLITLILMSNGGDIVTKVMSQIIFFMLLVALCLIQPLRCFNAISLEVSRDTLDLLSITRLNSWKIVFGKWVSIVSQSLIFACSIIPYLILRYFLGDMLLFEEVFMFICVVIISLAICAIVIGCSAIKVVVVRYLITGGVIAGPLFILFPLLMEILDSGGIYNMMRGGGVSAPILYLCLFLPIMITSTFLVWTFLDFGTSMIAPQSENRSTVRKIVFFGYYLLIAIISSGVAIFSPNLEFLFILIQGVLIGLFIPFFIILFTEQPFLSPRVALSFKKKRWKNLLRNLLYPGWATSSIFLFFCIVAILGLNIITYSELTGLLNTKDYLQFIVFQSAVMGSLLFPAALISLFCREKTNRLVLYLIFLIGENILTIVTFMMMAATASEDIYKLFIWLPMIQFFHSVYDHSNDLAGKEGLALSLGFNFLCMLIILMRSKPVWKHIREQEKVAVSLINE